MCSFFVECKKARARGHSGKSVGYYYQVGATRHKDKPTKVSE